MRQLDLEDKPFDCSIFFIQISFSDLVLNMILIYSYVTLATSVSMLVVFKGEKKTDGIIDERCLWSGSVLMGSPWWG